MLYIISMWVLYIYIYIYIGIYKSISEVSAHVLRESDLCGLKRSCEEAS